MSWENRLFAYAKTKTQISFAVNAKLIRAFVFAIQIVQSLFYLNPKFQASAHLLSLCSLVCVGPGRKPRRPVFSQRGSYSKTGVCQGIHFFFLFLLENIDCGYSLEPPQWGGSNVYPKSMFKSKKRKILYFSSENYYFYSREILMYIAWACLRNAEISKISASLTTCIQKPAWWFTLILCWHTKN